MTPLKVLHFADAHIDTVTSGKHDPLTGLPVRVIDFLKSLDSIVNTAINQKVDLVIFAGDAFRDRTPTPTIQREWMKRIFKLSRAEIPCLLIVGNHDISPALGRASTLHEFDTLEIPFVRVSSRPELLTPDDLWGLDVQIITVPWINKSAFMALTGEGMDNDEANYEIENLISQAITGFMKRLDPNLPTILTAHASVHGAVYAGERKVMLGKDVVLPAYLVKDSRLDYVALGHIHKMQDLNLGSYPPAVYPGSIERVDFGEKDDPKGFIIADVHKGKTTYQFYDTETRPFIECNFELEKGGRVFMDEVEIVSGGLGKLTETVIDAVTGHRNTRDAVLKIVINFPKEIEDAIDQKVITEYFQEKAGVFDVNVVLKPKTEQRLRLEGGVENLMSKTPLELLEIYFAVTGKPDDFDESMKVLAADIIGKVDAENVV